MSNKKKAESDIPLPKGLNRVGAQEFIDKVVAAKEWALWVNPAFDEIELIVVENGMPSVFHGPDPMSMPYEQYKNFCLTVEAVSDADVKEL